MTAPDRDAVVRELHDVWCAQEYCEYPEQPCAFYNALEHLHTAGHHEATEAIVKDLDAVGRDWTEDGAHDKANACAYLLGRIEAGAHLKGEP